VRAALSGEGLPAHEDLVAWWGWHDGADGGVPPVAEGPVIAFRGENTLLEPWHVVSLEEALRIRRWYRSEYDGAGLSHLLPVAWVPVAVMDGRPVLLADASAKGPAPLHVLDEGLLEAPPALFESLADFAETIVKAFDEGAVRPSPMHLSAPAADPARLAGDTRRLAFF
jgi:hypothetical protein